LADGLALTIQVNFTSSPVRVATGIFVASGVDVVIVGRAATDNILVTLNRIHAHAFLLFLKYRVPVDVKKKISNEHSFTLNDA